MERAWRLTRRRAQQLQQVLSRLFTYERQLLKELGFELSVDHPYRYFVELAQELQCAVPPLRPCPAPH